MSTSSLLSVGIPVRIMDIRSGDRAQYAAWVTRVDEANGRHYVTKLNDNGPNRAGPPLEVIARALRFDDGTPAQDGEDYVIVAVTGTTADMTEAMTHAAKTIQKFEQTIEELKKDINEKITRRHAELHAVVETLGGLLASERDANLLRESLAKALPVTNRPNPLPAPVVPEEVASEESGEGQEEHVGAGAASQPEPTAPTSPRPAGARRRPTPTTTA